MLGISILFGVLIGLALGLTGGGGAIFAVPMLVYGLGVAPREAVGISLAAVGATSLLGFLYRWKLGQVEIRTGLLFAAAGMAGAPAGAWVAGQIPETLLILLFAGLMLMVAVRLWQQAAAVPPQTGGCEVTAQDADGPTCRRDVSGKLLLNTRCAILLLVVGVATGWLTGLFGVGGGFVIVPALILFSGMSMQRAVGTSLMVITLVSLSGVTSHLLQGRTIDAMITSMFIVGGIAGLLAGQQIGRKLSGPVLQKTFSVAIVAVAMFVIVSNLYS